MSPRFVIMLAAASGLLAQSTTEPASVSGIVTNAITGEPILRVHAIVRCWSNVAQNSQQDYGALTNEKGEFSISRIPPGRCTAIAERVGFVAATRNLSDLTGGTHKEGLKLPLMPTGSITGRVVNAAGEPMEGVAVMAEKANSNSWSATADGKGDFRVGGLAPGKYRIKATPQTQPLPPEIRSDGSIETHDAATWYPGTLDEATAQRVDVKAGAEVSAIEIKLMQTPIVRVSGTVTGIAAGAKGIMLMIQPLGRVSAVRGDGTFDMWRMDPGKYSLQAHDWGSQKQLMSAPVEIEVTTANVDHLELRIIPPFDIAGQLRFDDDAAREPPQLPGQQDGRAPRRAPMSRQIYLTPVDQQFMGSSSATVDADDSFTLEHVQPGRYRLNVNGTAGYVKSIDAGETQTDGDILDVRTGPPGPLEVTLSSNYCEISGTVSDSKGPVSDATIALVPAESPRLTQMTRSDASGAYKFRVGPGKYKMAVVDEGAMQWGPQGPDLQDYELETIEVSAGDKITKDLVQRKQ